MLNEYIKTSIKSIIKFKIRFILHVHVPNQSDQIHPTPRQRGTIRKNISKAHKKHESRSNGFVFPHFVASLYSVDISYRMVAFNLCESFVNSLTESIQITFLIVLLKTYEYSVPTCTRRNLAPKQTLTKHRVYFLGLFGVCLGSAFRKIRVCSGITMDLHEICS